MPTTVTQDITFEDKIANSTDPARGKGRAVDFNELKTKFNLLRAAFGELVTEFGQYAENNGLTTEQLNSIDAMPDALEAIDALPATFTGINNTFTTINQNKANKVYKTVFVDEYGAIGDGTTDDGAAILAAIAAAGIGGTVIFGPRVYATSVTIINTHDGQRWLGTQAGGVFSFGHAFNQGTVLKWIGATGGGSKLAYFGCAPGGSHDLASGGIEGIQFNGELKADICLHLRSCNFSTFKNVKVALANPNSASATGLLLDSDVQSRGTSVGAINSMYRCNFYNIVSAHSGLARGLVLTGASNETGGRHPAFISFHGLHVVHQNGDAVFMESADDIIIEDLGISKGAGGTGLGIHIKPKTGAGATYVAGCTFLQITVGSNDTPTIRLDGANCRGLAFYGVQGVDAAPTLVLLNGAQQPIYDYCGNLSGVGAVRYTPGNKFANLAATDDATLDYYKEKDSGAFTIYINGSTTGITTSVNYWQTTRVGRVVLFEGKVTFTSKGVSAGAVQFTLPYYVRKNGNDGLVNVGGFVNMDTSFSANGYNGVWFANSIYLQKVINGVNTNLQNTEITNTSTICFLGHYITTDANA